MQWLFLSEGTNQLFSLILKLKQVKTSEKSSEKCDFRVKRENHFFHEIFHSFSRVSASKSHSGSENRKKYKKNQKKCNRKNS